MEEKLEKFERLAEKRVTEAIKKIRLVGNLANKNNYEYNEEHVKQIIDALESEMRTLKNRFRDESLSETSNFEFKNKK
ncbi:hypothetical protein [Priestia megaterium]|uniref:hypothetical protein n=1 Tax=Priestia megaterium TaxID=1404 RepID=UPI0020423569|nr:hypothetical protein [Priestia megaterium]MCM3186375.1 hypothetical protein [Priestia megaterium]